MAKEVRIISAHSRLAGPPPQTAQPVNVQLNLPYELITEIDPQLGRQVHRLTTEKLAKGLPISEREAEVWAESLLNHRELMLAVLGELGTGQIPLVINFPAGILINH